MKISNRLRDVKEYYFSSKLKEIELLKKDGKDIINLAIGNPDLPPAPSVISRLCSESIKENQHGYQSYSGNKNLRISIANWYKIFYDVDVDPEKNILPLIGAKEGILHICFTYINQGDEVLIPNPGYPTYSSAVIMAGGIPIYYNLCEENNWNLNLEELEKKDLSKVKIMWVNYPNMPTGAGFDKESFSRLLEFGRKKEILICHDNPYSFIRNNNPLSILSVGGDMEGVIELNSLSKSHNMAGWRVGMLISSQTNVQNILRFKSNMDSGMFLPVQLAAVEALSLRKTWYEDLNKIYHEREKKAEELASLLKCSFKGSQQGLFLWAKIPDRFKDCFDFCDKLLYELGVFVTPGYIFGSNGERYIRISLCSDIKIFDKIIYNLKKII